MKNEMESITPVQYGEGIKKGFGVIHKLDENLIYLVLGIGEKVNEEAKTNDEKMAILAFCLKDYDIDSYILKTKNKITDRFMKHLEDEFGSGMFAKRKINEYDDIKEKRYVEAYNDFSKRLENKIKSFKHSWI